MVISGDFKGSWFVSAGDKVGGFFGESGGLFIGLEDSEFDGILDRWSDYVFELIFLFFEVFLISVFEFVISIEFSKVFDDLVDIELFHVPVEVEGFSVNTLRYWQMYVSIG